MSPPQETLPADVLTMRAITKHYGASRVLDAVDFTVRRGEIHALLGENGAGKTTLMNVLRGLTQPTAGSIAVDGTPVTIKSPVDSTRLGIGMVHQHFLLVPAFTVDENLVLAGQQNGLLIDRQAITEKASVLCEKLHWNLPFKARVSDLTVGVQQRVEILKALLGDTKIVLFDEPTAVLTPIEVGELLDVLRALRDDGRSLVFVSHKLDEVMAICDHVTVLRRGQVVGEVPVSETSANDLARRMVGDDAAMLISSGEPKPSKQTGPGLSIAGVSTERAGKNDVALKDLTFDVPEGRILGFAGVDGNGQEELFEVLAGVRHFTSGRMTVDGRQVERLTPSELAALGISLIPPDRQKQGLALTLSIRDNLLFDAVQSKEFRNFGLLANRRLDRLAEDMRREYDVRTPDIGLPASSLSGGNQQKIVIARALSKKPRVVVAASPTRGLDVAATAYVHGKLRQCRDNGAAIILISTELDEVIALSDDIAVLYEGRIASIVPPTTPREEIGLLMGGKNGQEGARTDMS